MTAKSERCSSDIADLVKVLIRFCTSYWEGDGNDEKAMDVWECIRITGTKGKKKIARNFMVVRLFPLSLPHHACAAIEIATF